MAVILPGEQKSFIRFLHPYFSPEFEGDLSTEDRLRVLFSIKDKWTLSELEAQLATFLEPETKLGLWLGKNTRSASEPNVFDKSKSCNYFVKKF
jgi:hypothetical protein